MDNPLYHVLLEGRRVGPYDRRTIVGMRIKKAIASADVLVAGDGRQLTVGELVKKGHGEKDFQPSRSGSYSVVQATLAGALVDADPGVLPIPAFRGEIEVRVQTKVLRLEGRYRHGMKWKQDRVKVALQDVAHARTRGSLVDLALNTGAKELQRLTLELFTSESALELVQALQPASPWPRELAPARRRRRASDAHPLVWIAIVAPVLVVGGVLIWTLAR